MLGCVQVVSYILLFGTLQAEDYALLIGSIGLFVIVVLLMIIFVLFPSDTTQSQVNPLSSPDLSVHTSIIANANIILSSPPELKIVFVSSVESISLFWGFDFEISILAAGFKDI